MSDAEKEKGMDKAEAIYNAAFQQGRDPRSDAYKRGVLAALIYRFTGVKVSENRPYKAGSAEFDAFYSGADEGHKLYFENQSIEIDGAESGR